MMFQKTTFERLFPAALSGTGLLSYTSFGFESGGKRFFDITVPGRPRIEQGMTVIALLEKPNRWESNGLLGWVDCLDGSVVCDSAGKLFSIALLNIFFAAMFPIRAYEVFSNPEMADLIAFFVAAMFMGFTLRFLYLSIKALLVKKTLLAVRNHVFGRSVNTNEFGG
ncbi:hypothetical protein [Crenobacter cavernae]|uniref:Uncharacterized protein n=1 Tax=Crenobacter cavernae TaxID=2290923 RepID=A0A345Y6N8_9NEIS|nr:hypothetical protein [Crenobacter cavernae]AXK39590.1 hypothetical protein DWG20_09120 [Crenobacter cavernae]